MIRHTELQLGPVTLLSRPNAGGWTWVHFGGIASNDYNIQCVHMSRLNATDGISEILEKTVSLSMLTECDHDSVAFLAARRRAIDLKLCTE